MRLLFIGVVATILFREGFQMVKIALEKVTFFVIILSTILVSGWGFGWGFDSGG